GDKQKIIQKLIGIILDSYDNPTVATGIVGNIVTLKNRPPRTEMRSAKEFSTLLNACGRNRRAEIGVQICLNDQDAFEEGKILLQQHRRNLALAIRRVESGGFEEKPGMYVVNDPETQDTIIGVVIGMAQGSRIIPWDRPVIGVSTNTTDDSPLVKISGRAKKQVLNKGVNLKDIFSSVSDTLNEQEGKLVAEAGGHPMAAGAFVHMDNLEEFLERVSKKLFVILGI
ncbi:MAG: DHHA1 domain-containing protein, partial [Candidatus Thorarchaeota archaeon]